MAHPNLHAALGFVVGTTLTGWPLVRAWRRRRPLAGPLATVLVGTYTLGLLAIVPDVLVAAGAVTSLDAVPARDLFVLHRWLDERRGAGLLVGELILFAHFVVHYALAVAGAARRRR